MKKQVETEKFGLGQHVRWVSQAGGIAAEKTGRVVEIIDAGDRPKGVRGAGAPRNHESYVVEAMAKHHSRYSPKAVVRTALYWPVAARLKAVR